MSDQLRPPQAAETQADHVIRKLGGVNAVARLLGHEHATTVQGWKDRGFVPAQRQSEVLAKAVAAGFDLTPEDFVVHLRVAPPEMVSTPLARAG